MTPTVALLSRRFFAVSGMPVLLALSGCAPDGTPSPRPLAAPDTAQFVLADEPAEAGQTVYVPVYSHVFHGDGTRELDLTATLSIRNTDPDLPITITAVEYYDSSGRLVRRYLEQARRLGPLASEAFVVEDRDRTGGVGANFLVAWQAATEVRPPIVEAVMISTAQSQGISFVSRGEVVRAFGGAPTVGRR